MPLTSCIRSSARALLAALLLAAAPGRAADTITVLSGVNLQTATAGVTLRLDFSHAPEFTSHTLSNPDKVYFDFRDTRLEKGATMRYDLGHPMVSAIRLGQFVDDPPVTRVVFDLPSPQSVKTASANDGKTLFIGVGAGAGRPDEPVQRAPRVKLTSMGWSGQGAEEATYVVELSELTAAATSTLTGPDRLVLDLEDAALAGAAPAAPSGHNGVVADVRAQQLTDTVTRVVFDLKRPVQATMLRRLQPSRIELRLQWVEPARAEASRGRHVVLDPGHGGKDPGTSGYRQGLKEKDVVLDVGLRAAKILQDKGVRVTMTRADDTFIPLHDRAAVANNLGADLFVSIHCNAMPTAKRGQRSGTEMYYYTEQSSPFAKLMLEHVARDIGLPARGTYQRRFVVVREALMPSVLVELGYLDNRNDGAKLDSPDFRHKCALGIVHGVMAWFGQQHQRAAAELEPTASGSEAIG